MRSAALVWLLVGLVGCDFFWQINDFPLPDAPSTGWVAVSAGDGFTCGIVVSGNLYCWGYNADHELGVNHFDYELDTPPLVAGATWHAVGAGDQHAFGIQTDGSLWCWGQNSYGQLGDNDPSNSAKNAPVQISTDTWLSVSTLGNHTCAIRTDLALFWWGYNTDGVIGVGDISQEHDAPVQVGTDSWAVVAAGWSHSCAITMAGTLWCWGKNINGQVGDGTNTRKATPVQIGTSTWNTVTSGHDFSCALDTGGAAWCWGENPTGGLGNGATTDTNQPGSLLTTESGFVEIVAGWNHACVRRADDTIACWGEGSALTGMSSTMPMTVDGGPQTWTALALGRTHTCGIGPTNDLWCTGDGSTGQLGTGVGAITTPVQVATNIASVVGGLRSTCALGTDGMLSCWGANDSGQVGDGSYLRQLLPETIGSRSWTQLAFGAIHGCALDSAGIAWCWGDGDAGIGDGTGIRRNQPTQIGAASYDSIVAGGDHSCAIAGVSLACWGDNNSGELGLGSTTYAMSPMPVAGGWRAVATGIAHTCALDSNSKTQCTGDNSYHQLGNNSTTDRSTMAVTSDNRPFVGLIAGTTASCAIDALGTSACWGRNDQGQLGTATTVGGMVPTDTSVLGGPWKQIALGDRHACGLDQTGGVRCWGYNNRGQLGNGTLSGSTSSVVVPGLTGVTSIAAGNSHTCAIDADHTLWCWGENRNGELGTGTNWISSFTNVPLPAP